MASLDSTSTLDEVKAAYADNASYSEDGSAAKARAFIVACRILLIKLPERVQHGGSGTAEMVQLNLTLINQQLADARAWLAANGAFAGGARVRDLSFEEFRT